MTENTSEQQSKRTPRDPKELSHAELIEELEMTVWADAINEAEDKSPRTVALQEELLRRLRLLPTNLES